MAGSQSIIPTERIEQAIYLIRGQKILLDADLAMPYGVEAKYLTRAVRRNAERFPSDFMFQLTKDEFADLKCHIGTSSSWGGRRYPPYAFTEQVRRNADRFLDDFMFQLSDEEWESLRSQIATSKKGRGGR